MVDPFDTALHRLLNRLGQKCTLVLPDNTQHCVQGVMEQALELQHLSKGKGKPYKTPTAVLMLSTGDVKQNNWLGACLKTQTGDLVVVDVQHPDAYITQHFLNPKTEKISHVINSAVSSTGRAGTTSSVRGTEF